MFQLEKLKGGGGDNSCILYIVVSVIKFGEAMDLFVLINAYILGRQEYNLNLHVPHSGKLSREKTFMNFVVLGLSAKVFSVKIDGHTHY